MLFFNGHSIYDKMNTKFKNLQNLQYNVNLINIIWTSVKSIKVNSKI